MFQFTKMFPPVLLARITFVSRSWFGGPTEIPPAKATVATLLAIVVLTIATGEVWVTARAAPRPWRATFPTKVALPDRPARTGADEEPAVAVGLVRGGSSRARTRRGRPARRRRPRAGRSRAGGCRRTSRPRSASGSYASYITEKKPAPKALLGVVEEARTADVEQAVGAVDAEGARVAAVARVASGAGGLVAR